jgi:hypothetical protein
VKIRKITLAQWAVSLLAAAALAAGCSGGPSSTLSPGATSQAHLRPLQTVSTRVEMYNSGSLTIAGSGSASC